jgi:Bifunctional PLP-dependent enzyme with beta-cystathionase and maltose regulon repressor activities
VVIHTPAYDAFYKAIEGNQRSVLPVALEKRDGGWRCDMDKLEAALAQPQSKILLLCSPQNPTGKVWTRTELEIMAELCQRHGVRVISDEIHMDMVWGEQPHIPWSNVARGSWALLTSASKSFNIPALTGAYGLIEDAESRNQYLSALKGRDGLSSPAVLALVAHIAAYEQGGPWLDALRNYLRDNLRYVADALNDAFPTLNWQPPESTYLAWIDLRPLGIDDGALQKALIEREKIAIMPGYTYGDEGRGFVRLNAGCPRSKLEKGVAGLINALRSVR